MSEHHYGHDHGHDHHHEPVPVVARRAQALESLLIEKGLLSGEDIDALVRSYENDIGPTRGAAVVARAWVDPAYKARLLADAPAALAELGIVHNEMVVVENTQDVHNVVVCTLCSCYPWSVLGLPPSWYKSAAYRSRVVIQPREVLREFGTELGEDIEVRVWDSSAEMRYMVLPERPEHTEGMSEAELAELATRDAMIGVTKARQPATA
ncbi:MAG TPA: nitrile hydratase subunit alpha [Nitrolancea sp.]|nr:nitrile hydratase subunit alpha [Nitrolancea sp.]